jgi:hypothetical protein
MKTVQAYIADKQMSFSLHPFFAHLQRNDSLREVLPFISNMSFWAMSFQDVLRINESKVQDPQMRKIARHHRAEDSGHDKWFLNDVLKIEGSNPDVRALFSSQHAATRDATYALMAEVFQARTDAERILLLLALESTGHIFFEAIASYFERMGVQQSLQYFARHHIEVEKSHEVFEQQMNAYLATVELSEAERASACALVDRIYAAFIAMFDNFERIIAQQSADSSSRSSSFATRLLTHEAQARAAA